MAPSGLYRATRPRPNPTPGESEHFRFFFFNCFFVWKCEKIREIPKSEKPETCQSKFSIQQIIISAWKPVSQGPQIELHRLSGSKPIEGFNSPNSACTMGFWRFQGLVKVRRPGLVPGHAKSLKNHQFLSFFKKNGAGARVLDSTFSFFDECLI